MFSLLFGGGAESDVGEPAGDLLEEVDGSERLPERRGSFGEGGGPIGETLAMRACRTGGLRARGSERM